VIGAVEKRPFPIVLSAPSGAGKTTIARTLLGRRSDVGYSVSCTTRAPRAGERDGVDYHFLTPMQFDEAFARGEFAEWAEVHGNRYGTLKREIEKVMVAGRHVMLDIDVQGARQVVARFSQALTIFVVPPSLEALMARLQGRKSENDETLKLRLTNARKELAEAGRYQHVVVNDDLESAVARVGKIIDDEETRAKRGPRVSSADLDRLIGQLQTDLGRHLGVQL
jgi:guanylate kinase